MHSGAKKTGGAIIGTNTVIGMILVKKSKMLHVHVSPEHKILNILRKDSRNEYHHCTVQPVKMLESDLQVPVSSTSPVIFVSSNINWLLVGNYLIS